MALVGNNIVSPQSINAAAGVTFVNADGTTAKTLLTAGANGAVVMGVAATTTDISANNVQLFLHDSADRLIGTVNVPAGSGTDGTANAVNLLNATALPFVKADGNGNKYLDLPGGYILKAAPLVAVTAAKTLTIMPFAWNYDP